MKNVILVMLLSSALSGLSQKPLLVSTAKHPFSNPALNDSFVLTLTGNSVLKGHITLHIYRSSTVIFTDTFPASDLLGDMYDAIPTDKQRADTILGRMKTFFAGENFVQPAIKITQHEGSDDSEFKTIQAEIRSDPKAIGFVYSHGYEGTYAIVWSKKNSKAVLYYESD